MDTLTPKTAAENPEGQQATITIKDGKLAFNGVPNDGDAIYIDTCAPLQHVGDRKYLTETVDGDTVAYAQCYGPVYSTDPARLERDTEARAAHLERSIPGLLGRLRESLSQG